MVDMKEYEFVREFSKKKVLVVGDIMVDRWEHCIPVKISQEAPVLIMRVLEVYENLGGAGNAALNLKAMGADVSIVAAVGYDQNGHFVEELLREKDVLPYLVWRNLQRTITKVRIVSEGQQIVRIDYEDYNVDEERAINAIISALRDNCFDFVFVSDYGKGVVSSRVMDYISDTGLPYHIDPKGHNYGKYQGARSITPNEQELDALISLAHKPPNTYRLHVKASALQNLGEIEYVLLTKGKHGVYLKTSDAEYGIQGVHIEVADPTGAGDSTATAFAMALECGAEPYVAAKFANKAGAAACVKAGVHPVTVQEILSIGGE